MSYKFLSEQWFNKVKDIADQCGNLNVDEALNLALNVTVVDTDDGECDFCVDKAIIVRGHSDTSPTKLVMTTELAHRIFLERDSGAGMEGLMAGDITVEGNMDILIAMQTAELTAEQESYENKVLEATIEL